KNAMLFYKFNGGSFTNGIAPFTGAAAGSTLAYPTVASVNGASACTPATGNTSAGHPTYFYTPALTNIQAPTWGVADVEVALFQGYNNAGPTPPTGVNKNVDGGPAPSVGATTGIYDNIFGVAVTHNVFTGAHPKTNFSKAEVAGILAGNITDWSQLA